MARRGVTSRLYRRGDRWWADLRAYSDVGGGREPLKVPGTSAATTDRDVAQKLLTERIQQLEAARRNKGLLGYTYAETVHDYADYHLRKKARQDFSDRWLAQAQKHLERAEEFFGGSMPIADIDVAAVQCFSEWLSEQPSGRGGGLQPGTVRAHLNSLSNLYKRAQSEGRVPVGYNPVASMIDKPRPVPKEPDWFEVHEAALILEAARRYRAKTVSKALGPTNDHLVYPIVACFLLTGGRKREVLGLLASDVSFDRKTIAFRPNTYRGLKTRNAVRNVPLFRQLEEVLRPFVFDRDSPLPEEALLFPSSRTGRMITSIDKALDRVAEIAGFPKGLIRSRPFRHTYCAARLQTLDRGEPIPTYTVSRELGHGGASLVQKLYGHLGEVRHRSDAVEYRMENHRAELADRIAALGWV